MNKKEIDKLYTQADRMPDSVMLVSTNLVRDMIERMEYFEKLEKTREQVMSDSSLTKMRRVMKRNAQREADRLKSQINEITKD